MSLVESGSFIKPTEEIGIAFCDAWKPRDEPNVGKKVSFGIRDPRISGTINSFCIGFTYIGGPYGNPNSWEPSGTLYWADDDYPCDSDTKPRRVSNRTLDQILKQKGTSVNKLFKLYLEKHAVLR